MSEFEYKENINGYKVLTPNGWSKFAGIRKIKNKQIFRLEFENNIWIECTSNHKLYVSNQNSKEVLDIQIGECILTSDGKAKLINKIDTGRVEDVYDLIEVELSNRYYTNGLLSSNCEFVISDETLINATTLAELEGIDPVSKQGQVRWYATPSANHVYLVSLDPCLGTGGDNAAIQVYELPDMKQIAEWQHNKTPIQKQIGILKNITEYLSEVVSSADIYYSVENNTLGEAALVAIAEVGEENIKGSFLSEPKKMGQSKKHRKGFTTTNSSKLAACAKLKSLIESKRLTVNSKNLISELKTFVALGNSYEAKTGETDDLVMSTILAVRMAVTLSTYDPNLEEHLRDNLDQILSPMPFIIL